MRVAAVRSLSRFPEGVSEPPRASRAFCESPVCVWRASPLWLLARRLGMLDHGAVIDPDRERHREVTVLHRSVEKPREGLATEPQEPEVGRVSLPDVLDNVEPGVLGVDARFLDLADLQPEVLTTGRGPEGFDLDDPVTTDEIACCSPVSGVMCRAALQSLLVDDEGQGRVFNLPVGAEEFGWGGGVGVRESLAFVALHVNMMTVSGAMTNLGPCPAPSPSSAGRRQRGAVRSTVTSCVSRST